MRADGTEKLVSCYDNRGSFGELALMYNTPRAATIIATSTGALWCLVSDLKFTQGFSLLVLLGFWHIPIQTSPALFPVPCSSVDMTSVKINTQVSIPLITDVSCVIV